MTSQVTFENVFRRHLLDLIYGQWAILGSPFSDRGPLDEIIDPEALLWCSLEFLPTEPRLAETVTEWIYVNEPYLLRQRIYKQVNRADPRAIIWQALDHKARSPRIEFERSTEICHGLTSPADVLEFAKSIEGKTKRQKQVRQRRLGRKLEGPATLLLRARDLLGQDIRHFLLIYLLAIPHGGKLRDVQAWSGHAYRSLSEAADRWEAAAIVSIDSGFCRLIAAEPFRALLKIRSERIVLVNWLTVFETSVRLLRGLAKARSKGFAADSPIPVTLQREAVDTLESSSSPLAPASDTSVGHLLHVFPNLVA